MSPKSDVLLQMYAKAPAPIRDYYGITISRDHVVLNIWNISYGPHVYPKKFKKDISEFLDDKELQYHIGNTFGTHVKEFVMSLARKDYNLQHLPIKLFLKILKMLATRDILNLSQTSKIFFNLCDNDKVWKMICYKQLKRNFTNQELLKAEDVGWKQFHKEKIVKLEKGGALNNNNDRSNNNKKTNIDIIRNVKQSSVKESPTNIQAKKINDLKRSNEKEIITEGSLASLNSKTDIAKNVKSMDKGKGNAKVDLVEQKVKSTLTLCDKKKRILNDKKTEDRKIRSVTDVIKAVSTSRIHSGRSVRNKSAIEKIKK